MLLPERGNDVAPGRFPFRKHSYVPESREGFFMKKLSAVVFLTVLLGIAAWAQAPASQPAQPSSNPSNAQSQPSPSSTPSQAQPAAPANTPDSKPAASDNPNKPADANASASANTQAQTDNGTRRAGVP